MRQSPFLFLGKAKNADLLAQELQALGVTVVRVDNSDSAYTPARVVLAHPSFVELAIVFHRCWLDGENQEDDEIALLANGLETPICNVSDMLRGKFDRPLAQVIVDRLRDAIGTAIRDRG